MFYKESLKSSMDDIAQYFQHPNSFINNSKFVFQMFPKVQSSSSLSPKCFFVFLFTTIRPLKYKSK